MGIFTKLVPARRRNRASAEISKPEDQQQHPQGVLVVLEDAEAVGPEEESWISCTSVEESEHVDPAGQTPPRLRGLHPVAVNSSPSPSPSRSWTPSPKGLKRRREEVSPPPSSSPSSGGSGINIQLTWGRLTRGRRKRGGNQNQNNKNVNFKSDLVEEKILEEYSEASEDITVIGKFFKKKIGFDDRLGSRNKA